MLLNMMEQLRLHMLFFFFSSRRRHTRFKCDWSSDMCSSDLLLNSTVTQYEQALELIENRFGGGIDSELQVQQARIQLETTRAHAIDLGSARSQYVHDVARLIGKPPTKFRLPTLTLIMPSTPN